MDGSNRNISEFDLIIKNGNIIDGTGKKSYKSDIGIKNGIIKKIGNINSNSHQVIDASKYLVTPGFVDIHTHYDGQAIWESKLAPSSLHGVTTVVMGNCGVGFAPCKPRDRKKLVELMEGVEDIPAPVMHEGLTWRWETFEEYLDNLNSINRDIDICTLLPHAALRVYVMGDRAIRHERANKNDLKKMRIITKNAILAGAFGFSTSRTISHKSLKGEYTPTLRAHEDELIQIALGMKDAGTGIMEIVSDWNEPDPETEFNVLKKIAKASGRPIVFSLTQRHDRPHFWKDLMRMSLEAKTEGLSIRPVVAPRPIGLLLGLKGSQNPFSGTETYKRLKFLSHENLVKELLKPEIKKKILSEDRLKNSTFPLIHRIGFRHMYRFGSPPNYNPSIEESIEYMSVIVEKTPEELAYDILLENYGNNFIYAPLVNFADNNFDVCREMLIDKNTIMGLGDGGAHVGFILDAGFPTWLLSYWARDKKIFSIEESIRRLTSDTANAIGLFDRGVLKEGLKADINVIDLDNLSCSNPFMIKDLPAGGSRLMQTTIGYIANIVSGNIIYLNGIKQPNFPGKLVKSEKLKEKNLA